MAAKKVFTEIDAITGRKTNWKEIASQKIAISIQKGQKVYICKSGNRYNLIVEEK